MIRAAEMDVKGSFDTRLSSAFSSSSSSASFTKTKISEHVGVPPKDLVLMDLYYEGDNSKHLRHFVAVDHRNQEVVLSIRGTFSLSEIFIDIAGFSSK